MTTMKSRWDGVRRSVARLEECWTRYKRGTLIRLVPPIRRKGPANSALGDYDDDEGCKLRKGVGEGCRIQLRLDELLAI
jgi:hypothetical protein